MSLISTIIDTIGPYQLLEACSPDEIVRFLSCQQPLYLKWVTNIEIINLLQKS